MLKTRRGERSDTLEGVSLSELLAFAVLVAHIPHEIILIYTVGVTVRESVDECVHCLLYTSDAADE